MSIDEMEEFLREINDKIIKQKLDILGFDSCVMSMLEVGYQFKDYAKTMIASEGSVPSAGWTYTEILGKLAHSSKNTDIKEIATDFVRHFVEKEDSYTLGGVAVDMAAWDLTELEGLEEPFAKLNKELLACFEDENRPIYRQMKRVLSYVHRDCQSYMLKQNVDLGDFCELLRAEVLSLKEELNIDFSDRLETTLAALANRKDLNKVLDDQLDSISEVLSRKEKSNSELQKSLDSIIEACDEILDQLKECVLLSGFSGGNYQFSNGISLFFPWSKSAFEVSKNEYQQLHFIEKTKAGRSWNKFLVKYLDEVTYRRSIWNQTEKKHLLHKNCAWTDTDNEDYGMTDKATHKMGNSPDDKMGNSPDDKMGNSPDDKMASSSFNKMGGGTGHYFEFFSHLDNTELRWDISGFTKKQNPKDKPPI